MNQQQPGSERGPAVLLIWFASITVRSDLEPAIADASDPTMRLNDALYRRLLGGVYHSTSVAAWRDILACGKIMPNNGSFPFSHGQSKVSYCYSVGGISLLDFRNPSTSLVGPDSLGQWRTFLTNHKPLTILLRLNVDRLAPSSLIAPDRVRSSALFKSVFVPAVEACYRDTISVAAVSGAYVVCAQDHTIFRFVRTERLTDDCLTCLQSTFRSKMEKRRPPEVIRRPSLSIEVLTNKSAFKVLARVRGDN